MHVGRFRCEPASSDSEAIEARKEISVSEDFDKAAPEADETPLQEADDVEAHGFKPGVKPDAAATEEGPDVEAHTIRPNIRP
jgi:hypothetical protein